MREVQIPEPSLQRIRSNYAQFEAMVAIIAEALGINPSLPRQIDMAQGRFLVQDTSTPALQPGVPNGQVHEEVEV